MGSRKDNILELPLISQDNDYVSFITYFNEYVSSHQTTLKNNYLITTPNNVSHNLNKVTSKNPVGFGTYKQSRELRQDLLFKKKNYEIFGWLPLSKY